MLEEWWKNRVKDVVAAADPLVAKELEKSMQMGKVLVDYLMLQIRGVSLSIDTQPVKKAESVDTPPEGFRG